MVRKRSRKYESDDNDSDSDLDFDFENESRPAPKKYSLRERKAPLFTTDFDYYGLDEDEAEARRPSSDDEDFQVEADANGARSFFEPDPDVDPQNSEESFSRVAHISKSSSSTGLIDFEDIIRADIVVNKNKIDYDNMIQKTEIKLTQQPKKRGRKPKNRMEECVKKEEPAETVCEPDLGTLELQQQAADEVKEEKREKTEEDKDKSEGLPNGDVLEGLENGDSQKGDSESPEKERNSIEMVMVEPPPVQEEEKTEDDDDDVIVLGELKQDVIVLDD